MTPETRGPGVSVQGREASVTVPGGIDFPGLKLHNSHPA